MTLAQVKERVAEIKAIAEDDESAHSREDNLHRDVLAAIAKGAPKEWRELAAEALKTRDIAFARWCA